MQKPVALEDIVDALDFVSETSRAYLDRETGQIVQVTDEELSAAEEGLDPADFPDWQRELIELARAIEEDTQNRYVALPDRWELDEYRFLERFAHSYPDPAIAERLANAIRGRGAFRRFKETVHWLGISEKRYEYRSRCMLDVARSWCEAERVPYREG